MGKTVTGLKDDAQWDQWIKSISGKKLRQSLASYNLKLKDNFILGIKVEKNDFKEEIAKAVVRSKISKLEEEMNRRLAYAKSSNISRAKLNPIWQMKAIEERRQMR